MTDFSYVVVDTREKNMEIYDYLERNKVNVVVDTLDVGDIMIIGSEKFLIERKSANDLASSLISGRLFEQMRNLAENADMNGYVPILLVTGDKRKIWKVRKIKAIQVYGALNKIRFRFGIDVIEEKTETAAALCLLNLINMYSPDKQVKKTYPVRVISKKNFTKEEYARCVLEGFPALSAVRSKRLLEHYGSLDKTLEAMKNGTIGVVPGIGDKIADAVKEVF